MLIAIISGIVMLSLFDRAMRLERISLAQMKARFELFEIRDELRRRGRNGQVHENKWFSYMDTTLTRALMSMEFLSIWHAIAFLWVADEKRIIEAVQIRAQALDEMPALAELYDRYGKCLWKLMRERHALLWKVFGVIEVVLGWRRKVVTALDAAPETSTLLEYTC